MSDPQEGRAEEAFRAAFAARGAAYQPGRLDLSQVREVREMRRRRENPRRWGIAVACALVLASAAGVGVLAARGGPEPWPTASEPADGWRWESTRDLAVQVPDSWGYGSDPGSQWCGGGDELVDRAPFVDGSSGLNASTDMFCMNPEPANPIHPEGLPRRFWATQVTLEADWDPEGQADGTYRDGGWTKVVRTIGHGRLVVIHDSAHAADARDVLASAVQVKETDPSGCEVVSPVQSGGFERPEEPTDLASIQQVSEVAVCQYLRTSNPNEPGLVASRVISGAAADQLLAALRDAPAGSGPNRPDDCTHDGPEEAVVLRLRVDGEARDVHVFYGTCYGNGVDDGVTKRQLTKDLCSPLWAGRVRWMTVSSVVGELC